MMMMNREVLNTDGYDDDDEIDIKDDRYVDHGFRRNSEVDIVHDSGDGDGA